jgi:thiol-disulfide isomerase/thioredoxin
MMPRARLFFGLAAGFAAIIVAVLYGMNGFPVHATAKPPAVLDKLKLVENKPAGSDISFTDASGRVLKLADFRGRYVLVNLWATWCGPCIAELPELAKLNAELPQDRATVVPIDLLEKLDAQKVGDFLSVHDAGALPVYIDRELSVMKGFGANELPLTILIDADGHEVARAAGAQKWDDPASVAYLKALSAPPKPAS